MGQREEEEEERGEGLHTDSGPHVPWLGLCEAQVWSQKLKPHLL